MVFVGTPSIQTRALLLTGNPEQLVSLVNPAWLLKSCFLVYCTGGLVSLLPLLSTGCTVYVDLVCCLGNGDGDRTAECPWLAAVLKQQEQTVHLPV